MPRTTYRYSYHYPKTDRANRVAAFQDLKKEVDQHQPIKTKVSTLGNQLLRSCAGTVGGSDLERRLAAVDEAWLLLMSRLPDNEERLHAAQMELLPSRQALHELGLWLHGVEQTLQRDNDDPLPASLIDIRVLVHKYKVGVGGAVAGRCDYISGRIVSSCRNVLRLIC